MANLPGIDELTAQARACRVCDAHLPLGPGPVFRIHARARVLVVGQAPGTRVHHTGIPWNDPSGDRLRDWMQMTRDEFYDVSRVAIVPMGLCYPGRGKGGDLPPRPECAPLWMPRFTAAMPHLRLTIAAGQYAQRYFLGPRCKATLTETVRSFRDYESLAVFPLPHPSPRNNIWLKRNPFVEQEVIPALRVALTRALE